MSDTASMLPNNEPMSEQAIACEKFRAGRRQHREARNARSRAEAVRRCIIAGEKAAFATQRMAAHLRLCVLLSRSSRV